jgi:transposase-like protein
LSHDADGLTAVANERRGRETTVTVYSETFRTKLVQKMLLPNARPVSALAREAGLPEGTLYRWKKEIILGGMSTDRPDDKPPTPTKPPQQKPPHQWSAEEKLGVVLEATAVPEAELGAFLRRKGLHAAQLAEWRKQMLAGLDGRGGVADRKAAGVEARRVRDLERELRRKDKALAEAAALLILKKKAQAIWGDEDDNTDPEKEE